MRRRRRSGAVRRSLDPGHREKRTVLRVVGIGLVLAGLVLVIAGFASFFGSMGSMQPPRYFWCAFVGLPLLGLGVGITRFAFLGAVGRYVAGEIAPVGKDVVHYMADGTKDAVRDVASAVAEGIHSAGERKTGGALLCPQCSAENDLDANFCRRCGGAIPKPNPCAGCGEVNDPDARFCDNCGKPLG